MEVTQKRNGLRFLDVLLSANGPFLSLLYKAWIAADSMNWIAMAHIEKYKYALRMVYYCSSKTTTKALSHYLVDVCSALIQETPVNLVYCITDLFLIA